MVVLVVAMFVTVIVLLTITVATIAIQNQTIEDLEKKLSELNKLLEVESRKNIQYLEDYD